MKNVQNKADDVNQQTEDALNTIVKLTEQSGDLKKEFKKSIHETVSNMRNLIVILKDNLSDRISENSHLQKEVKEIKKELEAYRIPHTPGQVAPFLGSNPGLTRGGNATSTPSSDGRKKLYAEALSGKNEMRNRLTVKSKDNQTAEIVKKHVQIKQQCSRH
jgi:hypothetical protein